MSSPDTYQLAHPMEQADVYISPEEGLISSERIGDTPYFLNVYDAPGLRDDVDELIPYARVESEDPDQPLKPVLYVAGFKDAYGTFANKEGLGQAMAERGIGIVVPALTDGKMIVDSEGRVDPLITQAHNILAVVAEMDMSYRQMDACGHSKGGEDLALAVRMAHDMGWTTFDGARLAFLASAGMDPAETPKSLTERFMKNALNQSRTEHPELVDTELSFQSTPVQMVMGGLSSMMGSRYRVDRTIREVHELGTRKIDLKALADIAGEIRIFSYAKDGLFPSDGVERALKNLGDDTAVNISHAVPYSTRELVEGGHLGGRGAHHMDCVAYPHRVAGAVAQFMNES